MTLPADDEEQRARVVALYEIDGVRRAGALGDLARFAARLCAAPIGLVTVLDGKHQFFLGHSGVDFDSTTRETSFCRHAVGSADLLEVRDATRDPRFADNPLVTGETGVRFYAGAPIIGPEQVVIGTVCVLDTVPRPEGLTDLQRDGLALLAQLAVARLESGRTERAQERVRRALSESNDRFRVLADTMPQMVWSTRADGFHDYYNARWYEFTGVPDGSTDGEAWNGMFHPDDQDRAWARWRQSLETGEPYEIEYRLRHRSGAYRWVLGRALPMRGADGRIDRWFGTCTDIHDAKIASEERELISHELSHRIKNIFSVISGLVAFVARSQPDFADVAADLRGRITALGRAHDFVRPHSPASRPVNAPTSLHGLLGELFAPYQIDGTARITIEGDDVRIDDRSATPLALLFHELATNASKYGALSVPEGRVDIAVAAGAETVTLCWSEAGGPLVTPPVSEGFGGQLIALSAERQLGGTIARDWRATGLCVTVTIPAAALSR